MPTVHLVLPVWLAALQLMVPTWAHAQAPANGVRVIKDVEYQRDGPSALTFDLFPAAGDRGALPAVVLVSCGGWTKGARSQFALYADALAARGFVVATTECMPAPNWQFPAQLNHLVALVRWLRRHASDYAIDPTRIAVGGGSSGGHLAALVGLNSWTGSSWAQAPADDRVQAAVIFNGVLDVPSFSKPSIVSTNLTNFLGVPLEQDPMLWITASPLHHVTKNSAPFLLLHGTTDSVVPYTQSVAMHAQLRTTGVVAEVFTAEKAGHGFFNLDEWRDRTVAHVTEFLRAVLP